MTELCFSILYSIGRIAAACFNNAMHMHTCYTLLLITTTTYLLKGCFTGVKYFTGIKIWISFSVFVAALAMIMLLYRNGFLQTTNNMILEVSSHPEHRNSGIGLSSQRTVTLTEIQILMSPVFPVSLAKTANLLPHTTALQACSYNDEVEPTLKTNKSADRNPI